MTMSIRAAFGGVVLLLFFGLSPGLAQEATMSCGDCHEDVAKAFAKNPHARAEVECEVCHDGGSAHMEAGGDPSLVKIPRGFDGAENTCLGCHDRTTARRSHRMGAHANSPAVNCLSCHSVHHAQETSLVAKPQPELCASCHGTQASAMKNRPFGHRFGSKTLTCTTCHDPHARPGRENIRLGTAGEIACLACHSDKRGPFVFQHGASVAAEADCASCHEPHGSSNPNSLKRARVHQLCLECHSPTSSQTLGSQPPSFHNLNHPRYQNCTTCHVAIHGSNRSPALLK
jgi:DmsE family decaheme c-type cytochrome